MTLPEDYINRPVRSLQTMLQVLSNVFPALLTVNPDGIYGETTQKAVRASLTAASGRISRGSTRSPSATARLLPLPMQRSLLTDICCEAFGFVGSTPY